MIDKTKLVNNVSHLSFTDFHKNAQDGDYHVEDSVPGMKRIEWKEDGKFIYTIEIEGKTK